MLGAMQTQTSDQPPSPQHFAGFLVEVIEGPSAGATCPTGSPPCTLRDDRCVVGSADDADLKIHDNTVSRFHLELTHQDGSVWVEDLGSRNGTWIQSMRIERAQIPPGTMIRLGDTALVVRAGGGAAGAHERVEPIPGFVAVDAESQRVARDIRKVASSNASVLIRGETGTGKEMVARAIHQLSPRVKQPFVVVDCGSMAATLVASELFGHERGAFTGADRQRRGAFERAHGGTIFLDEIGELPLAVQPALLGALERRHFRRVGGDREIEVDVRVVSATHRDLRRSVNDGSFRADLYYRLAVARLTVPPLRERPQDIPALIEHFVQDLSGAGAAEMFGPAVMEALMQHRFSGNVRELRNVVESALAMGAVRLDTTSELSPSASPALAEASPAEPLAPYREARSAALDIFEASYLKRLVQQCGANASAASRVAQMDRNYLVTLLRKHGLR